MTLIIFGGLAFLFPLAIYLLILATLNRRGHPVMAAGPWDFSEVLLACSGFLLFGGPCALTSFDPRWRDFWWKGQLQSLFGMPFDWWLYWLVLLAIYFLAVIGGSAYLLWRRRLVTSVYNIEFPLFEECLGKTLDRLHLDWTRGENRFFVGFRGDVGGESEELLVLEEPVHSITLHPATERPPPPFDGRFDNDRVVKRLLDRKLVLDLEPFAVLRHVTIHWPADAGEIREEIELELARVMSEVDTGESEVGMWLLTTACCCMTIVFFTMLYLLIVLVRLRHEN